MRTDLKSVESDTRRREDISTAFLQELMRKYPPLLTQQKYCELTGKSPSTAEQDRLYGRGPRFIRLGRSIRYRLDDVIAWLESLPRYNSTSEADSQ